MSKAPNPIKHVEFSMEDYVRPKVIPGGKNDPLKNVTEEFRKCLLESLGDVKDQLRLGKSNIGLDVCTAIVELEDNATAKSHRPTDIFNEKTCPFFGDAGYGRMLIQVSSDGLEHLKHKILHIKTKGGIKALSAVKSISNYKAPIEQPPEANAAVIVRLFRYSDPFLNQQIDEHFEQTLSKLGCEWQKHRSQSVRLYKVNSNTESLIAKASSLTIIQSAVISNSIAIQPMTSNGIETEHAEISPPDPQVNYPIVGVVDSGVSSNCKPLSQWVVSHNRKVPEPFRDLNHGTFVSGMLSNSHLYNQDPRFPKCQSKIASVEVLGNNIGDIYDIVNAMYETAETHPEIKVWNLSLGSPEATSMYEISAMALMLDEFQEKYNCLCVIAAGNYVEKMRQWPPSEKLNDGVSSPGDSLRGLTVGSIAHVDGYVKNEEPSPFSRKGPVSNYVQKPDVVHFGGNMLNVGGTAIPLGVNSVCPNGLKRNDIGTSYATPIISNIAANLFHHLGQRATPNLVKALIIHNANMGLPSNFEDEHRPYYGWGIPSDLSTILEVNDYETTLAFEGHAQKSFEVEKLPFPIPDCLRTKDGKVRGEFFITLVYQPELDANQAFEYCQVDVKVGFGEIGEDGSFNSKVPPKKDAHLYEEDLVKNGDKWSPVKVYQKRFPRGVDIENWRLRVKILGRDGYEAEGVQVPFTILLTIRDIDKEKPVYNEMVNLMDAYNWKVSDLTIDNRIKV
ncbi:S8 family peptidase [Vibrio cortegadensis]|uniref:S8 family peptidase n=1 Tax=Vibrio cortegadensis TaxID=1328770 RepID=UPI0021C4AB2E|nr:S8 family peptidase [Vibrio cortegadensis]MDN3696986.1 S8 family peptidase [Vibrio cortegadensis]